MDVNGLRVLNAMKKLGLDDDDFERLEKEVAMKDHTGVYVGAVKNGVAFLVEHDDKHNITAKKVSERVVVNDRIMFKTLIHCKIPEQFYILHGIGAYRSLDSTITRTARSLEELKKAVIDRFLDKYPKLAVNKEQAACYGNDMEAGRKRWQEQAEKELRAVYWLFDEEYDYKPDDNLRTNISRVIKVFQRKNRRLAIIQEHSEWNGKSAAFGGDRLTRSLESLKIRTFKPGKNSMYDYVCPGREVYNDTLWLGDDLNGRVCEAELSMIHSKMDYDTDMVLTFQKYDEMQDRLRVELLTARRREMEDKAKDMLISRIEQDYNQKGMVTRGGITFTKKDMSYEGLTVGGDKFDEFIKTTRIILAETPDFNHAVYSYVDFVLQKEKAYSSYLETRTTINIRGTVKMSIGKVKIIIERRPSGAFRINGHGIRKDELSDVIIRAVNRTPEEYGAFLESTSKVSLREAEVLKVGAFTFELTIHPSADYEVLLDEKTPLLISLPFVVENGKKKVIIGKTKRRVKSIDFLFQLQNMKSMMYGSSNELDRMIALLYKGIDGLEAVEVQELITQGSKEYVRVNRERLRVEKAKIKKSKEFVANAVRLTNAEKVKDGWVVIGTSGTKYHVGNDNSTHILHDNNTEATYLCILDVGSDTSTVWGVNDCVAKRILALRHDKKVAEDIWKNGDHMDKHWLKLMSEVET